MKKIVTVMGYSIANTMVLSLAVSLRSLKRKDHIVVTELKQLTNKRFHSGLDVLGKNEKKQFCQAIFESKKNAVLTYKANGELNGIFCEGIDVNEGMLNHINEKGIVFYNDIKLVPDNFTYMKMMVFSVA